MESRLAVDLAKISRVVNLSFPFFAIFFFILGYHVSFYFHFLSVAFLMICILNFYYLYVQKSHSLLSNFGIIAQLRYIIESIGPEFRQYLYSSDTEERPFNRIERSDVYRKAKDVDSSAAFGTQLDYNKGQIKLKHSFYPLNKNEVKLKPIVFGSQRGIKNSYSMDKRILISAMSYGSLGKTAIQALARGAKKSGICMNTGEGGFPKYHLREKCDLIFQMGTAKFGVRNDDGNFCENKLQDIAKLDQTKMVEIKFSQGAKPGKGGLLPKEKINDEIAQLRGVPKGKDVVSPAYHVECQDNKSTVKFITKIQEIVSKPIGIKFCINDEKTIGELFIEMKNQNCYPDYISIDGAEGGTGAAPSTFLNEVGMPLFHGLPKIDKLLSELDIRNKFSVLAAGKLINTGSQIKALCSGADAIYTARGFMLALGCIQALQCNNNTCPVGITSHDKFLESGLDIEYKSERIKNYVNNLIKEHKEILAGMGCQDYNLLNKDNLIYL